MKIGMLGISGKPSTKLFSHNAGWTYVIKSIAETQLGGTVEIITDYTDIDKYDALVINEGLNYKKDKWNFIGGVSQWTHNVLAELIAYPWDRPIYSFNEVIDLNFLVAKRKDFNYIEADQCENDWQYPEIKLLRTEHGDNYIVGDSHSVSIYRPSSAISRNDGKTLYGFLKNPYAFITGRPSNVTLYFGNIDIRFHIGRQDDAIQALNDLVRRYSSFAARLIEQGKNVTIQALLPIEDESRKLPGTGKHYGENFYGTRNQRQEWVNHFNHEMENNSKYVGFKFRRWNLPLEGFEGPKFSCMESRQSVHLRPEYYLFKDELI